MGVPEVNAWRRSVRASSVTVQRTGKQSDFILVADVRQNMVYIKCPGHVDRRINSCVCSSVIHVRCSEKSTATTQLLNNFPRANTYRSHPESQLHFLPSKRGEAIVPAMPLGVVLPRAARGVYWVRDPRNLPAMHRELDIASGMGARG